jgi:hypothetical protein
MVITFTGQQFSKAGDQRYGEGMKLVNPLSGEETQGIRQAKQTISIDVGGEDEDWEVLDHRHQHQSGEAQ